MARTERQRAAMARGNGGAGRTGDASFDAVAAPPTRGDPFWRSLRPGFVFDNGTGTVRPRVAVQDPGDLPPEFIRTAHARQLWRAAENAYQLGMPWEGLFSDDAGTVEAMYAELKRRTLEWRAGERKYGRANNTPGRTVRWKVPETG